MKKWVVRNKSVGQTPLQVVELYRKEAGLSADTPLAYAGRLDPMADGTMLILIGEECKRQERYHHLDKAYRFQILFGFESDTMDVLGLADAAPRHPHPTEEEVKKTLAPFIGNNEFPYPLFSSKTVRGKPLHTWTLEKRLDEIEIPTKHSTIYALRLCGLSTKPYETLTQELFEKINSIPPVTAPRKALGKDFRREAVRARWRALLDASPKEAYSIATVYCEASSGTYMRTLAQEIARRLGTGGLAYAITRTKIGKRFPLSGVGFWYRTYH